MSESSSLPYRLCSVTVLCRFQEVGVVVRHNGVFVRRGMGAAHREESRPKAPGIWHVGRCVTCVWLVVVLKLLSDSAVLVFAGRWGFSWYKQMPGVLWGQRPAPA